MSAATRVGLIGLGEAGAGIHLPALSGLQQVTLAGVCDADADRRRSISSRLSAPAFATATEMIAEVRPDLVIVATPPASHAGYVVQSLEAGAHVLCEKPFVCSLAEADRVASVATRTGRRVVVNHEFRFMPIFRTLIEESAKSGVARFVQVWQQIDLPPAAESGWRGALAERALFEAGVHLIDVVLAAFREKPVAVYSAMTRNVGGRGENIVLVTLEFSGGRLAHLTQNRACRGERQYLEVRLDTDAASFRASFGGRARMSAGLFRSSRPHLRVEYGPSGLAWLERGAVRTVLARNPSRPNVAGTQALVLAAIRAFAEGVPHPCDAAMARDVIEVVAACYLSAGSGRRIDLAASGRELAAFAMGRDAA